MRLLLSCAIALVLIPTVRLKAGPTTTVRLKAAPTNAFAEEPCAAKTKEANFTFTLKDVTGADVALASFKGKVIVLNFWATWCVPCRTEIPALLGLQKRYGGRGLQVVGVSVDDPLDKLKPYVAAMKITYPVLQARGTDRILDVYGPLLAVPATFVIQRDGRICSRRMGAVTLEALEKQIQALL